MKLHKRNYQVIGFSGAVCFLFGVGYFLVRREFSLYVLVNILLGAAMGGFYLYSNLKEVSKLFVSPGRRGAKNIAITTALVLGIVIGVNLLSNRFYFGRDLTRDKVSSISEYSVKAVQWVKQPIEILVFSTGKDNSVEKYLLDSYGFYNRNISYRFVDPERNPQLAQRYGVTKAGQAVVTHKDGFLLLEAVTEEKLTNAVTRITQSVKNYVYFLQGHGEHIVDDFNTNQGYGLLWNELKNENYFVFKLKFEPPNYYIPGNCTILIVAGPRRMFTTLEVKAVREFLENGGRALFLLDPNVKTGLEELVTDWGIALENDCVLDVVFPSLIERAMAGMSGRKAQPRPVFQVMVNGFPEHEITRAMKERAVFMSVARSMKPVEKQEVNLNLKVEPLALTTSKGWSETHLDGLFTNAKISSDVFSRRGPLNVALLSTKGTPEADSRMIVIGDSDFVNNEYFNQLYNRDFFMNCMAFISAQASHIS
ncbi:MAG: hypothetical protein A2293_11235, partial [Elusimicrobia bacterium RIFOXYB2_FULL_49_7]